MTENKTELLPCPFCGMDAELVNKDNAGYIWCPCCGSRTGNVFYSDNEVSNHVRTKDLVRVWSTRATPERSELPVDEDIQDAINLLDGEYTTAEFRKSYPFSLMLMKKGLMALQSPPSELLDKVEQALINSPGPRETTVEEYEDWFEGQRAEALSLIQEYKGKS